MKLSCCLWTTVKTHRNPCGPAASLRPVLQAEPLQKNPESRVYKIRLLIRSWRLFISTSEARWILSWWIPRGYELCVNKEVWGQHWPVGELGPSNAAVVCLLGVVCLANAVDYSSKWVSPAKSGMERCDLQATGTWRNTSIILHAPEASEQRRNLFF